MNQDEEPIMGNSIVQEWATTLGLRHQGVLMSMTRGCDGIAKHDVSKTLTRALRNTFLRSFSPNPSSFIQPLSPVLIVSHMDEFVNNFDHYPAHFICHFMHAAAIVGYKHPDFFVRGGWNTFYLNLCKAMHVLPETESRMDARLLASEEDFRANSHFMW